MKTKILGLIAVFVLLACIPIVFAEKNQTSAQTNDTTDLNESDVSGFKPFMQQLRVTFEFNQERRAHLELELARLRLIQAKIAAKHNNTAAMESAIDAHNRLLEKAQATLNNISNKGGNVTGLERAIQVHENIIAKFNALLASGNLTAEQKAKIEARIEHVSNVTEKLKALEVKIQNKSLEQEQKQVPSCSTNKSEAENNTKEITTCTSCGCGKK